MYLFEFNLRTRRASKNTVPEYAVRYLKSKDGLLNKSGIQAITGGLMRHCLPKEYEKNLIFAIKKNKIKEIR